MNTKRILLLLILTAIVALYLLDPVQYAFMPQCPFKMLTGWSCPGCGIQRAAHAVLHGQWWAAINYNWFLLFSLPYALALAIAQWCVSPRTRTRMYKVLGHRYLIYSYIALFLLWGVIRNILKI